MGLSFDQNLLIPWTRQREGGGGYVCEDLPSSAEVPRMRERTSELLMAGLISITVGISCIISWRRLEIFSSKTFMSTLFVMALLFVFRLFRL